MTTAPDKRSLRAAMRLVLAQPRNWLAASADLCRMLAQVRVPGGGTVMGFASLRDELDVTAWMMQVAAAPTSARLALPRVDWQTGSMEPVVVAPKNDVHKLSASEKEEDRPAFENLERTRYRLWQPKADLRTLSVDELDVVLVPGLAFDKQGGRLGRGGGFYDRFLARVDVRRCALVGVALPEQVVGVVPMQAQDVRVGMIVTTSGLIQVGS